MKLKNTLLVVKDIEKSIEFYRELFGLEVVADHDGNVVMTERLVLQDAGIWKDFIKKEVIFENNAAELYFEEPDIEGFIQKLEAYKEPVKYVNPLMEHSWGQKVIRFYDPDGNLIEVGTPV
ncbi:MAG: VOC family protein [Lachnospiraceae bacterium]